MTRVMLSLCVLVTTVGIVFADAPWHVVAVTPQEEPVTVGVQRVETAMQSLAWAYHTNYQSTWLVTCAHCVPTSATTIAVWAPSWPRGVYVTATVIARGEGIDDIAVIRVPIPMQPVMGFGIDVARGDSLQAVVWVPDADEHLLVSGYCMGSIGAESVFSVRLDDGMDGAPLLNADGQVCGMIHVMFHPLLESVGDGFIPISQIQAWLRAQRLLPKMVVLEHD